MLAITHPISSPSAINDSQTLESETTQSSWKGSFDTIWKAHRVSIVIGASLALVAAVTGALYAFSGHVPESLDPQTPEFIKQDPITESKDLSNRFFENSQEELIPAFQEEDKSESISGLFNQDTHTSTAEESTGSLNSLPASSMFPTATEEYQEPDNLKRENSCFYGQGSEALQQGSIPNHRFTFFPNSEISNLGNQSSANIPKNGDPIHKAQVMPFCPLILDFENSNSLLQFPISNEVFPVGSTNSGSSGAFSHRWIPHVNQSLAQEAVQNVCGEQEIIAHLAKQSENKISEVQPPSSKIDSSDGIDTNHPDQIDLTLPGIEGTETVSLSETSNAPELNCNQASRFVSYVKKGLSEGLDELSFNLVSGRVVYDVALLMGTSSYLHSRGSLVQPEEKVALAVMAIKTFRNIFMPPLPPSFASSIFKCSVLAIAFFKFISQA